MSNSSTSSLAGQGWSLCDRHPATIEAFLPLWEWFYQHYFRVKTEGWEHIPPDEPVLLVGSHNGGLASPDTIMFMVDWFRRFGTQRPVYGLMHPSIWKVSPQLGRLGTKLGAVKAHPKMAIAALKQGASVLVYPGGAQDVFRPYNQRYQIHLAGRKGFIKLALREKVTLIPLISTGAHETLIVLQDCYGLMKWLHEMGMPWLYDADPEVFPLYLGLPWGMGMGPLPNIPLPVPIHTRVCEPIIFDDYGKKASSDRAYVDTCYNLVVTQMQQALDRLVLERV